MTSNHKSKFDQVDQLFSGWNLETEPGAAIGIIENGELIYTKGYGSANLEYDIKLSKQSVFRIGSTSKQFTAACIAQLVLEHKINLKDKLSKFFPAFPDYADQITISHLLHHTSGIRDYLMIHYLSGMREEDYYDDTDIMNWLVRQKDTNFPPGQEFLYSNSGYWLLAQIVKKVTGESMAIYAEKHIFKPLGMNTTHFHENPHQIVKNRATGYSPDFKGGFRIHTSNLPMIGDGSVFSTIEDLYKWDQNFYNPKVGGEAFLKLMSETGKLNDGSDTNYSFGLFQNSYKGLNAIMHGGAFVGFRAEFIRFPKQKFSVIVLSNRGDANPTEKAHQIIDIFLKDHFIKPETIQTEPQVKNDNTQAVKLEITELEKYCSSYWNSSDNFTRTIYLKDDILRYLRPNGAENDLIPIDKNRFRVANMPFEIILAFTLKNDKAYQLEIIAPGQKKTISDAFKPVNYTEKELKHFEGTYYSDELSCNYHFSLIDKKLYLRIEATENTPTHPVKENLFINDYIGSFAFEENSQKDIKGFRLAAGRVKNLYFKKI